MKIIPTDPTAPDAKALITASDAYMMALYPAVSNHLESVAALAQPNVLFLGGYLDGKLVACGAVRTRTDDGTYGEIKRVFVLEQQRGKGFSKAIMQRLEEHLLKTAVTLARLETGIRQPAAIGLYKKLGYRERPPFAAYQLDPFSLFMEKNLKV
jgi:putative acetyltransferase